VRQYSIADCRFSIGATAIFVVAFVLALVAAPLAAEAQQPGRFHQIGFLVHRSPEASRIEPFRQGLRALGYIEGQNITIEQRYTHGAHDRLRGLAAELVRREVGVIVVDGTVAAMAARAATTTIPIVFVLASDPVGSGLVASLARPGGNVTGLSTLYTELTGKQLQMLKEAVPEASRVTILCNPENPAIGPGLNGAQATARALGIQLQVLEVRRPNELEGTFSAMAKGRAGALLTLPDALFSNERVQLLKLAAKSRLPAIFSPRDFVEAGGLMSYGPNVPAQFRRAATYVDRILKGAKPGDLPIEQPTKFELVINLKTAKTLGLTIPQSLLVRADEVIQ
jgi:putative ABC transport system substrate-binding protein